MKLRNLLFAVATCAGLFTACSNDMEDAIDNGNNNVENAEAYAAVSFVMPSAASTRAGEEVAVGSSEENQVTNVTIALFNEDGTLLEAYDRKREDFTPEVEGGSTTYTLKSSNYIAIKTAGTYSVHVIVNPTTKLNTTRLTLTEYNKYVEAVAQKTGKYCTDNNFMMTNATPVKDVTITTAHTKTNPAAIQINVERLAAKITFDNNNVKEIKNEAGVKIGSITFDAYKVVNTRNSAWGLRRVGDGEATPIIGDPETDANYVIENMFAEKATFKKDFFDKNYSRKLDTYVAFRKLNESGVQTIAYSLENTMAARIDQNKGYTTGIILRGKATLNADQMTGDVTAEDGTFYRLGSTFYGNWNELLTQNPNLDLMKEKFGKEGEDDAAYKIRISNDKVTLYQLGIELYAQGYCYYYYWLNHRPHTGEGNKEKVGMMEYAIVRNNVYALSINSVTSIGNFESGTPGAPDSSKPSEGQEDVEDEMNKPNPELPGTVSPEQEPTTPAQPVDPNEPVIDNNMYLKVTINVNPWTVRRNSIDL